jgi:hypothetical protein
MSKRRNTKSQDSQDESVEEKLFKKEELDKAQEELKSIIQEASKIPVEAIAPKQKRMKWHNAHEKNIFIKAIAELRGITEPLAFAAIAMLFVKGAANKGTPASTEVELEHPEEKAKFKVTKNDLIYHYERLFGSNLIRRMAESMAEEISEYAQSQGLSGDLAKKINTRLIKNQLPILTREEAAWCSSFC